MTHRSITIGSQTFPSQAALKTHIDSLFDAHQQDAFVANAETHQFLMNLLPRHQNFARKFKHGVTSFKVIKSKQYKNSRYETYLIRADGSQAPLSLHACIAAGKPRTKTLDNLSAMANTIEPQLTSSTCESCHCEEHTMPMYKTSFRQVANDFMDMHGMCEVGRINTRWGFGDMDYAAKWAAYHKEHAHVQMLCKTCSRKAIRDKKTLAS
jgi:hypothetical protein